MLRQWNLYISGVLLRLPPLILFDLHLSADTLFSLSLRRLSSLASPDLYPGLAVIRFKHLVALARSLYLQPPQSAVTGAICLSTTNAFLTSAAPSSIADCILVSTSYLLSYMA